MVNKKWVFKVTQFNPSEDGERGIALDGMFLARAHDLLD